MPTMYMRCPSCGLWTVVGKPMCIACGNYVHYGPKETDMAFDLKKDTRELVMSHVRDGRVVVLHIWTREPNRGKYVVGLPGEVQEPLRLFETIVGVKGLLSSEQLKKCTRIGWSEDDTAKAGV